MKLLVKQRVFSWTDSYDVYDENEEYPEDADVEVDCKSRVFVAWTPAACI